MKSLIWVLLVVIAAGLLFVAFWTGPSPSSGASSNVVAPKRKAFVVWRSPAQYIDYVQKTEPHDNPDLWRRIEAVKRLPSWPN